jgi:hypothetical protein
MRKKSGFTVVEVMLSITIMTMVAVAVFPIVGFLVSRGRNFVNENRAGFLLQEGMEVTYNVFLGQWDESWLRYPEGIYHPAVEVDSGQNEWILLTGLQNGLETRFSRQIEIFKVCRDSASGEMVSFPCFGANVWDKKSRLVKTTVYWQEGGKVESVSSDLLLTELRE